MSQTSIDERFADTIRRLASHLQLRDDTAYLRLEELRVAAASLKPRTVKAVDSDLRSWMSWWSQSHTDAFIHDASSVAQFFAHLEELGRAPVSVARSASSIKRILAGTGLLNTDTLAVIELFSRIGGADQQRRRWEASSATPFGWENICKFLEFVDTKAPNEVHCTAALLLMYDGAARVDQVFGHKELGDWHIRPLRIADIRRNHNGTGRISLVSNGDEAPRSVLLSQITMGWIDRSIEHRRTRAGALFVSVLEKPMHIHTWKRAIRRVIVRAGMDPAKFSEASPRLGALSDLLSRGNTPEDVRRASGWGQMDSVIRLFQKSVLPVVGQGADAPHEPELPGSMQTSSSGRYSRSALRRSLSAGNVASTSPVQLPLFGST